MQQIPNHPTSTNKTKETMIEKMDNTNIVTIQQAVNTIKTAILQSQLRALTAVNQEQLALYYGIGRYVSANTRNKNWGAGMIKQISYYLQREMPGLRGFSETNLKNMRLFFEAWSNLEVNSSAATDELDNSTENQPLTIRQLQLTNLQDFPILAFLGISFTHHVMILNRCKDYDERLFYIRYCADNKISTADLDGVIAKDMYHHQAQIANNFIQTLPDYRQAYQAIQMFKDDYLLDYINAEQLGVREEEIDERVVENAIVFNVRNFIMTFGKGFAYQGHQVHYEKLSHEIWIDLLFFNRDLNCTTVFELKTGPFKTAYLAQLSEYLRVINDEERHAWENPPIGIILCKSVNRAYVEYIMQDFKQPMGVVTYKTSADMDEAMLKVLPPKEELRAILEHTPEAIVEDEAAVQPDCR